MAEVINPSASHAVETVKVQDPNNKGDYIIINKSDLTEEHELFEDEEDEEGVESSPVARNASGTHDEPTPTDIRYPNKNTTEFENNHGAFLGQSASELRDAAGMDDKPGGLHPEVHEEVQEAEALKAAAAEDAGRTGGGLKRKVVVKKTKNNGAGKSKAKDEGEDEGEDDSSKS